MRDDACPALVLGRSCQVRDDVLREYDSHVHHRSDGDRNASQRHDVRVDAGDFHRDERSQDREWEDRGNQERGTEVPEHHQHDEYRHQDLLKEGGRQCVQCLVDQPRPIVERLDGDLTAGSVRERALWQAGSDFCDLRLHSLDDLERVLPVSHDDNATYGFGTRVIERATPLRWAQGDARHVGDAYRRVLAGRDDRLFRGR